MRVFADRFMAMMVWACGALVIGVMLVILWYLAQESSYAFSHKYGAGYALSVTGVDTAEDYEILQDLGSSVVSLHTEGSAGVDDNEATGLDLLPAVNPEDPAMQGGVACLVDAKEHQVFDAPLSKFDRRGLIKAEQDVRFLVSAYATSTLQGDKMRLNWGPDSGFLPNESPFKLTLKLVKSPEGVGAVDFPTVDLAKQPVGSFELPAWKPKDDNDRRNGYLFEIDVQPQTSTLLAVVRGFFSLEWAPSTNYPRFGMLPLLLGTLQVTLLAILFSTPLSLALAVYIAEFASQKMRDIIKPIVELLASMPTVILGFFGVGLVAPGLQAVFGQALQMESSRTVLTCSVTMAILIIPVITTIAEDGLRNLPRSLRDGADALGLTDQESLQKVVVPAAKSSLIAAILLGFARAAGETMIVFMLSGQTAMMPKPSITALGQPTRGMADNLAAEVLNVEVPSSHYGHLFLLGLILMLITLTANLVGFNMARKSSWRQ